MPPELYLARPDRYERSNAQDCRPRPGEAERFLRTGAVRLPLINGTFQADDLFPNRSPPFTVQRSPGAVRCSPFTVRRAVGSGFGGAHHQPDANSNPFLTFAPSAPLR